MRISITPGTTARRVVCLVVKPKDSVILKFSDGPENQDEVVCHLPMMSCVIFVSEFEIFPSAA